jgi:glyoxylase-like metal-dependent hydrolase (beta-lactamase superfamily II)
MILRQFLHSDPVAISYLFGCGGHAACAVVDPLGDIRPYRRVADETGMRIRFVIDTHIHADHRASKLRSWPSPHSPLRPAVSPPL